MKNAKLGDVIAFVLRSMNEETRQTDEEAEAQMKRLIRILVLEGYVNEQECCSPRKIRKTQKCGITRN